MPFWPWNQRREWRHWPDFLGSSGLGLSIAGGAETVLGCVVIHEVYPGSAAHQDGRLAPGDRIIAVNGVDISTYTHNQASEVLRKSGTRVRLRIVRDENGQSDTMKVRLNKVRAPSNGQSLSPFIRFRDKALASTSKTAPVEQSFSESSQDQKQLSMEHSCKAMRSLEQMVE